MLNPLVAILDENVYKIMVFNYNLCCEHVIMFIMNITLESIQLTESDLSDFSARLSSQQELYSLTAPAKPIAQFGWRDRWWLNRSPAAQIALNYWFYQTADEAYTAADTGRVRLSAQSLAKFGGRESIYQPVDNDQVEIGDSVWQAGANWLFVRDTVVILVAEIGGQIPAETTLEIARKIKNKLDSLLA